MSTIAKPLADIHRGDKIAGPGSAVKGKTVADIAETYDFKTNIGEVTVTFADGSTVGYEDWNTSLNVIAG